MRALDAERGADAPSATPITGVEALVRLLDEQRRLDGYSPDTAVFVSGYEGSPLAGFDLQVARHRSALAQIGVTHQPGLNEELAATAVLGTQLAPTLPSATHAGVVGIWYGKAPGLDRAMDAIRHANLIGAHHRGGVLAVVGDDSTAKSSTVPSSSEPALAALSIPTLVPAGPDEVLTLGLHGIALSRYCGLWVALKMSTAVADGLAEVDAMAQGSVPLDNGLRHVPTAQLLQPTIGRLEQSLCTERLSAALRYARVAGLNRATRRGPADKVGIISAGATHRDTLRALELLDVGESDLETHGMRLLKLDLVYPVDEQLIVDFCTGLSLVVVVEEKQPFIESAVKAALQGSPAAGVTVLGKRDRTGGTLFPAYGDLRPAQIAEGLKARLATLVSLGLVAPAGPVVSQPARHLPVVSRTPYFCSGCPHNRSTQVPSGTNVGAGIGCHAMVLLMDPDTVGNVVGLTQMGGEGAQWIGAASYVSDRYLVQNLGDGTYQHSGSLAIRAAVAANLHMTYKLLFNRAVAMTGGQAPVGNNDPLSIARSMLAEGVARVIITTEDPGRYRRRRRHPVQVWHRDRLDEAQRVLRATPGVSVLIHDQECAAETRRRRKRRPTTAERRVMINERVCEGCGDCGRKSNCLSLRSVDTPYGRKTQVDQSSCNLDRSCLLGDCPAFITVKTTAQRRSAAPTEVAARQLPTPPPVPRRDPEAFTIRLCGVGGSGIVTAARVIAIAAATEGWQVAGLDQTGLAQKGGSVTSDLRLWKGSRSPSNRLSPGECDLLIAADPLTAATPEALSVADLDTSAVISTSLTPPGQAIGKRDAGVPSAATLVSAIRSVIGSAHVHSVAADDLARNLFGTDESANILLLGFAVQCGVLALSADAVEAAIRKVGVGVERSIQAFRAGREAALDRPARRELVPEAMVSGLPIDLPDQLAELSATRYADLIGYQNRRFADRFAQRIADLWTAESALDSGLELTAAAIRNLHKLMAYKDEYEVARLSLLPHVRSAVERQFGTGARYDLQFHPPILRALGWSRKISFGRRARPALRALVVARFLRGSLFDPFGYTAVRRLERRLLTDYEKTLDGIVAGLEPANHAVAVELASLPDLIRGFEQVKQHSADEYQKTREALLAEWNASVQVPRP